MEYYLGIDLGGTNIKAGVVDDAFHIIGRAKAKTGIPRPAEEVMDAMAECAKAAAADAGVPWERFGGLALAYPERPMRKPAWWNMPTTCCLRLVPCGHICRKS